MTDNMRPEEGDSARYNDDLPEAMQRAADAARFSADEVRRHFARLLSAVEHRGEHVTITRYGKPAAVIVPAERIGTYARVDAALEIARKHGDTDGAHHKQWVIDQMMRALSGGREGLEDPGIAP